MEDTMLQDRLMRDQETDAVTGTCRKTRDRWSREGKFPKRKQVSPRIGGYSAREVNAWIMERLHGEKGAA